MTDLIILKQNSEVLRDSERMNSNPEFGSLRNEYWQKTFVLIKKEFIEQFPELANEFRNNF